MSIPSSQIERWSNQGSIDLSSATYKSIQNAFLHSNSPIANKIASGLIRIELQGSYAHDTNVRGDSDIDVIVRYTNTFHSNKLLLPNEEFMLHEKLYPQATYNWEDLRGDVILALERYYGANNVDKTGKKSIKVLSASGRLRTDVVPVISYKRYSYFRGINNQPHVEGVAFKNLLSGDWVVNYPEQHYANAVAKHKNTNSRYKGIVRVMKNMRSYLVEKNVIAQDVAPSYFIQGLVYNVPDDLFVPDTSASILSSLRWFLSADLSKLISQNEQHKLVGNTGEYWRPEAATETINKLCNLWDKWGDL